MRPRKDIENDSRSWERLTLEVLLDIRDILKAKQRKARTTKQVVAPELPKKRRGRPPKVATE